MSIRDAHSYADSNTIGDAYANTNSYVDSDPNANSYATATDTYANGNNHPNSNCNFNTNTYGDTYKPTWECLLSANDGGPYSCSKHAVEFYGSGERD